MDSEMRDALRALTTQAAVQAEQTQAMRLQLDEIRHELKSIRQGYTDLRNDNVEFRKDLATLHGEAESLQADNAKTRNELAANTTAIRQAHVLIEENRALIELVAEGVTASHQRLDSFQAEVSRRFDDQDSFFRSTLGHLASSHGRRLDRLEHHTGLN